MKVFISYRHVEPDRRFLKRLTTHLASIDERAQVWADTGIEPGDDWRREIEDAITRADVAIVLVSADSVASPFIRNVELPMLLAAHRERRLLLVPLFVAPSGQLPGGIAELQGVNSPGEPLVAMSRARQEATLADFVKWLGSRPPDAAPAHPVRDVAAELPAENLERVPAAGLLFDRAAIRRDIASFLSHPQRRICIIHGFPGIGKTSLAATMVEKHRPEFDDVFWFTCRSIDQPGLVLMDRLASFLQRNGDHKLRGLLERLSADSPDSIEQLVAYAIDGLTSKAFLLVLDEFHTYLSRSNELLDEMTRRLLGQLLNTASKTKILLLADRRPSLEHAFDRIPAGAALERQLLGLPEKAVRELLAECGLNITDVGIQRRIGESLDANPALIQVYCSFVARQRGDPLDVLAAATSRGPVAALIGGVVADLTSQDRETLERLAVLRAPLNWDQLGDFGLTTDDVVPLLDSWLVVLDPSSHTVAPPPAIRDFVLEAASSERLLEAHRFAAEGYEHKTLASIPRSYDEVRPLLESGYHRIEAGDVETGAAAVLSGVEVLIGWGYADLASGEIIRARAHTQNASILARCDLQEGRIHDQRGRLGDAQRCYQSAVHLAEEAHDDRVLAEALFRLGRVHNARSEFEAAERDLGRCLELCRARRLGQPEARALVALVWSRKERGATVDVTIAGFQEALRLAEEEGDLAAVSDAHRQLGFISWFRLRNREQCEWHYAAALKVALEHSLAKEIGAIYKELSYLAGEWGDFVAADEHYRAGIDAAEALQDQYLLPGAKTNLALVLVRRGDLQGALDLLTRSVREFADFGNRGGEAYALHELARVEAMQGERNNAITHLEGALRLSRENGLILQGQAIEATYQQIVGEAPTAD